MDQPRTMLTVSGYPAQRCRLPRGMRRGWRRRPADERRCDPIAALGITDRSKYRRASRQLNDINPKADAMARRIASPRPTRRRRSPGQLPRPARSRGNAGSWYANDLRINTLDGQWGSSARPGATTTGATSRRTPAQAASVLRPSGESVSAFATDRSGPTNGSCTLARASASGHAQNDRPAQHGEAIMTDRKTYTWRVSVQQDGVTHTHVGTLRARSAKLRRMPATRIRRGATLGTLDNRRPRRARRRCLLRAPARVASSTTAGGAARPPVAVRPRPRSRRLRSGRCAGGQRCLRSAGGRTSICCDSRRSARGDAGRLAGRLREAGAPADAR